MIRSLSRVTLILMLLGWMCALPLAQAASWDPFNLFSDDAKQQQLQSAQERADNARARAEHAEIEAKMARELAEREAERYERMKAQFSEEVTEKQADQRKSMIEQEQTKQEKGESLWNKVSPFGWLEKDEPRRELAGKTVVRSPEDQKTELERERARQQELAAQAQRIADEKADKAAKKAAPKAVTPAPTAKVAILETEKGPITIELYPQDAPVTVANFVHLVKDGFYNQSNMKFHRVVPGFVVQTGDPTGTGAGGSKERIPLEVDNKLSHDAAGVVAMARGQDINSASSQFYITLAPQKTLDGKYAVFGRVISGIDVLPNIEANTKLYGIKLVDPDSVTRDTPEKKGLFGNFFN